MVVQTFPRGPAAQVAGGVGHVCEAEQRLTLCADLPVGRYAWRLQHHRYRPTGVAGMAARWQSIGFSVAPLLNCSCLKSVRNTSVEHKCTRG